MDKFIKNITYVINYLPDIDLILYLQYLFLLFIILKIIETFIVYIRTEIEKDTQEKEDQLLSSRKRKSKKIHHEEQTYSDSSTQALSQSEQMGKNHCQSRMQWKAQKLEMRENEINSTSEIQSLDNLISNIKIKNSQIISPEQITPLLLEEELQIECSDIILIDLKDEHADRKIDCKSEKRVKQDSISIVQADKSYKKQIKFTLQHEDMTQSQFSFFICLNDMKIKKKVPVAKKVINEKYDIQDPQNYQNQNIMSNRRFWGSQPKQNMRKINLQKSYTL